MNVILLTDFSSGARHAHKYALNLFANIQVNYFLLHSNCENSKIRISSNKKLEEEICTYRKWGSNNSKLMTVNTSKNLIDAIRNMMETHVIDLVVMGANGDSQNSNNSLGTNTKSTATKIKCPVLIVFQKSIIKSPFSIAFPVDYTDKLKQSCIEKLKTLPNSSNFLVELFEVNTKNLESTAITTARDNLLKGLDQLIINCKKENDFNINYLETIDKKEFDLISFAAKNLSVYNVIFNQLDKAGYQLMKQPPLYILHE